jgi:peroxidase
MTRKTLLPIAFCCIAASISCIQAVAQQKRFIDGFPNKSFIITHRFRYNPILNGLHPPFRSYDGTNNNVGFRKTDWGAADIPLFRELPAAYGPTDPKNAMGGINRPTARKISNLVIDEPVTTFNGRGLSAFVYVWGQFIDHDMSLTPTGTTESVPVVLPPDETVFTEAIPFTRSEVREGTGVTTVRDQTNLNTSWLDASMIYGADSVRANYLRTRKNGKLRTSAGNYLPYNTITGELGAPIDPKAPSMANDGDHTIKTFVAGDVRAAEHPGLSGLHTLFLREHNRICDRLVAQGLRNDELIYQLARKEIGALIQAITYQEFLPAIGITLNPYSGYRPNVRPDIMNTFATAGYRIGHTMVADDILLFTNACEEVEPGELDLVDVFWAPQMLINYGLEPYMKGFAAHTQYETDTKINSVLRNMLFGSPNDPVRFGIDLGSLNIQRGRDHGLPDYNTARRYYTGSKALNFSQITTNTVVAANLQSLYGSVDNIDLWIGILAEDHLPGKSVGNTMHRMLKAQFENLRDGDYYFYRFDPFLPLSTKAALVRTKFSDVLKRNTTLTSLQDNVFFTLECPVNDTAEVAARKIAPAVKSLDENGNTELKMYPNPATSMVTVDLGNTDQSSTIKLFNANGVLLKTITPGAKQKFVRIDISGLPKGMYMISIQNDKGTKSLKLIKPAD